MTAEDVGERKIVCEPGKHIVFERDAVITRCVEGCHFIAIACHKHEGFAHGERRHFEHMRQVRDHSRPSIVVPLERAVVDEISAVIAELMTAHDSFGVKGARAFKLLATLSDARKP